MTSVNSMYTIIFTNLSIAQVRKITPPPDAYIEQKALEKYVSEGEK